MRPAVSDAGVGWGCQLLRMLRAARRAASKYAAGVGLGVGATLAGCSAPVLTGLGVGGPATGSLDYWNLFGGGDGVRMNQMLEGFRAANPTVNLDAVTLAWGNPYYTKFSLATLGQKPRMWRSPTSPG